jgi:hypothetical protein
MSRSQTPTRWPNGLVNVPPSDILAKFRLPYEYGNLVSWGTDFDRYRAADWVDTVVGTGTVAQINELGGVLALTTSAGATDAAYLDKVGEVYQFGAGYQTWFASRVSLSDATNTEMVLGLQATDTTPTTSTNGVYFHKPSGGTRVYLVQVSATTGLTTTTDTGYDMLSATYAVFSYYHDANGTVFFSVKDATGTSVAGGSVAANLPTVTQTISFGVLNSNAAVHTMKVDYVFAAQDMTR